ncbi:MAG TPA: XdhC/CoxI family protein [Ktedonobacterales bacterium]|nr:XdhC/CoxI family protein [Ktedonobacterales bacterium]
MAEIYETLKASLAQERPVALATLLGGAGTTGAKLLVFQDGETQGTLGNATLDARVAADAHPMIWQGAAKTITYAPEASDPAQSETAEVFIEAFPPPHKLVIVGAGHIAIPLTTFGKTLGYRVIVVDARAVFATRERFPHADEVICEWPDEVLGKTIPLHVATAAAVLTHDPKFDEPTLRVLLNSDVGYIGAIGSRKTGEERNERLRQQGITDEQLARIHGPIGLNIGAVSPEEMALAIMAEIVAARHGRERSAAAWQTK